MSSQNPYAIGDQMWLSTKHLKLSRAWKFKKKFISLYEVLDTPPNIVCLQLSAHICIHNIVIVEWVKPYYGSVPWQEIHQPWPIKITEEGFKEWEAESIINFWLHDGKL